MSCRHRCLLCRRTRRRLGSALTDLQLLVPSPPVAISAVGGIIASTVAGVSFSSTIGLGSIITAAVVVVAAGLFTLRNNLKSFWKTLAEERAEQVKVLEEKLDAKAAELVDAQVRHTAQMTAFSAEQHEIRAELKSKNAALEAQLELEHAKHDLSSVTARLDKIEVTLDGRRATFDEMAAGIEGQTRLLVEIRDRLPR